MKTDSAELIVKNLISLKTKLCGLYLLERNIILLSRSGFKTINITMPEDCISFYTDKISGYIKNNNINLTINTPIPDKKNPLQMPSDIFIQQHHFNDSSKFLQDKGHFKPVINEEIFIIQSKVDQKKAEQKLSKYIIENTGGFIAQKINKRVSIPISLIISKTRIHPNYLTIVNMITGFLSAWFIYLCASDNYSSSQIFAFMVTGGFLFQAASVLDGVDGEVAKFTLKVSRLGGWLDTFSDNMTLLLFLTASSYLYYFTMGGFVSVITILVLFSGLVIMLAIMVNYLSKYSDSGSLVTYDKEFLQKLPESDWLVTFTLKMKYITKKEMFSIIFFIAALTGHIYFIIPAAAFVLLSGAIILTIIHFRYRDSLKKE